MEKFMPSKNKILAVDDNSINLLILENLLSDDYDLKVAVTGEQALEMAQEFRPDVVLLDIHLPGIDGFETGQRLKNNPVLKQIKIIMVSATEMPKDHDKQYCPDDFLIKPFHRDELFEKIRSVLSSLTIPTECNTDTKPIRIYDE